MLTDAAAAAAGMKGIDWLLASVRISLKSISATERERAWSDEIVVAHFRCRQQMPRAEINFRHFIHYFMSCVIVTLFPTGRGDLQ